MRVIGGQVVPGRLPFVAVLDAAAVVVCELRFEVVGVVVAQGAPVGMRMPAVRVMTESLVAPMFWP